MPPEQVEALAQGRVWLGATAAEQGLVDTLGDRRTAIARAAELAKLETYDVREVMPPMSPGQVLLQELLDSAWTPDLAWLQGSALRGSAFAPLVSQVEAEWRLLSTLTDPRHQYALCGQCAVATGGPFGPW
jgi:protease-4